MAGERSQRIYGRIRRTLRIRNVSDSLITSKQIYDEMNEAQKQIYSKAKFDKEKTISLTVGTTDYDLTDSNREVFGSIIKIVRPDDWRYEIDFVSPMQWDDVVNSGEFDNYTNPVRATIFDNKLKLYPAPTAAATLTIFANLMLPTTNISESVDPSIPDYWDRVIEDYAFWRILGDAAYFQSFEKGVEDLANVKDYRGFAIQKPAVW